MKHKILNAIYILVFVGSLLVWWQSKQSASEYNEYAKKLRVVLKAQDKMINELSKSTNAQAAKRVTQWIEKSKNITKQLVTFTIESKGIRNLHQLWIRRSKQITKGMHSLKLYFKTGEKKLLLKYRAHLKKAGAILKEFKAARNAYFKKNKLKLNK